MHGDVAGTATAPSQAIEASPLVAGPSAAAPAAELNAKPWILSDLKILQQLQDPVIVFSCQQLR